MGTRYAGESKNAKGEFVPTGTPKPKPTPKATRKAMPKQAQKATKAVATKTTVTRSGGPVRSSYKGKGY